MARYGSEVGNWGEKVLQSGEKWDTVPVMQRSVLLGEYEFTLDAKNRVAVPARLRPAFAEGIFLTRGFEKYIAAFPPEEWDRFVAAPRSACKQRAGETTKAITTSCGG